MLAHIFTWVSFNLISQMIKTLFKQIKQMWRQPELHVSSCCVVICHLNTQHKEYAAFKTSGDTTSVFNELVLLYCSFSAVSSSNRHWVRHMILLRNNWFLSDDIKCVRWSRTQQHYFIRLVFMSEISKQAKKPFQLSCLQWRKKILITV